MHWDEEDWGFCCLTFEDFFFDCLCFSLPSLLVTGPEHKIRAILLNSYNRIGAIVVLALENIGESYI